MSIAIFIIIIIHSYYNNYRFRNKNSSCLLKIKI